MKESIHSRVKKMPNPSPGLLRLLRRHPRSGIWAVGSESDSLLSLKKKSMHTVPLRLGAPDQIKMSKPESKAVMARVFDGVTNLRYAMFGHRTLNGYSVGHGKKGVGVWMVDVTEVVVEGLNRVGACFLSPNHCKFTQASPRIKQCQFCKRKLYKKIVIKKEINWVSK